MPHPFGVEFTFRPYLPFSLSTASVCISFVYFYTVHFHLIHQCRSLQPLPIITCSAVYSSESTSIHYTSTFEMMESSSNLREKPNFNRPSTIQIQLRFQIQLQQSPAYSAMQPRPSLQWVPDANEEPAEPQDSRQRHRAHATCYCPLHGLCHELAAEEIECRNTRPTERKILA